MSVASAKASVIKALRELGIEFLLDLELRDPQYAQVLRLSEAYSREPVALICVLGALTAYRLSGKGEDYWREVANHFLSFRAGPGPDEVVSSFAAYLGSSKLCRLALKQKLARLAKLASAGLHKRLYSDYDSYVRDLRRLWLDISRSVRSPRGSKTVVFAVKMFCYAVRASTGTVPYVPADIPLPVDARVMRVSRALGVAAGGPESVRRTWQEIAMASGVPPLHVDVLLWMLGSLDRYEPLLAEVARLHKKGRVLSEVVAQLRQR